MTELFTKKIHHCNTSVFYFVQNLFPRWRHNRTISSQAEYIVVFKSPVSHLTKQMYPGRVRYMQEANKDATLLPCVYVLIDLKQETPEHLRMRANVYPDSVQCTYLLR